MAESCQTYLTENVQIRKWDDGAQQTGCVEYCGLYYINMLAGNTDRPDIGIGSGSYLGAFDFCGLVSKIASMHSESQAACGKSCANPIPAKPVCAQTENKEPEEDNSELNAFLESFMVFVQGVGAYDADTVYSCNDWVIFEGELVKSLVDDNSRHPHDSESWKGYGDISNVLTVIFDEKKGCNVTLPCYESCGDDGCVMPYNKGVSVVVKTEKFDTDGNPVLDDCGNPVFDEFIHTSLVDNNTSNPALGSVADQQTWTEGLTASEFFGATNDAAMVAQETADSALEIATDAKECCEANSSAIEGVNSTVEAAQQSADDALSVANAASSSAASANATAATAQAAAESAGECCDANTQTLQDLQGRQVTTSVNSAIYESTETEKTWYQVVGDPILDPVKLDATSVIGTAPATVDGSGNMVFSKAGTYMINHWYNTLGPRDLQGGNMASRYQSLSRVYLNGSVITPANLKYTHHTSNANVGEASQHMSGSTAIISVAAGDVLHVGNISHAAGAVSPATGDAIGFDKVEITITEFISTVDYS